jgi:hypothetical protein
VLRVGAMTLEELSEAEQIVLLALVGLTARLDGNVSEIEVAWIDRISEHIGRDRFEAVRDAAAKFADPDAILEAAGGVTRPEAREVIYELVYDMASSDTIAERESDLLSRLAKLWDLPERSGDA